MLGDSVAFAAKAEGSLRQILAKVGEGVPLTADRELSNLPGPPQLPHRCFHRHPELVTEQPIPPRLLSRASKVNF